MRLGCTGFMIAGTSDTTSDPLVYTLRTNTVCASELLKTHGTWSEQHERLTLATSRWDMLFRALRGQEPNVENIWHPYIHSKGRTAAERSTILFRPSGVKRKTDVG